MSRFWLFILSLFFATSAFAAVVFPHLSGRVVDEAGILTPTQEQKLTEVLAAHEAVTSNQLIVVTLKDLGQNTIEDYGYKLGREWGIGQKDKNNGVLFIIAPNDRQVRIEVGYGLEGQLTDALSRAIIEKEVLPHFKAGDYAGGIEAGVKVIIAALDGNLEPLGKKKNADFILIFVVCIFAVAIILVFISHRRNPVDPRNDDDDPSVGGRGSLSRVTSRTSSSSFRSSGGRFGGGGSSGKW